VTGEPDSLPVLCWGRSLRTFVLRDVGYRRASCRRRPKHLSERSPVFRRLLRCGVALSAVVKTSHPSNGPLEVLRRRRKHQWPAPSLRIESNASSRSDTSSGIKDLARRSAAGSGRRSTRTPGVLTVNYVEEKDRLRCAREGPSRLRQLRMTPRRPPARGTAVRRTVRRLLDHQVVAVQVLQRGPVLRKVDRILDLARREPVAKSFSRRTTRLLA
jgi:hypothetical protein